MTSMTYGHFNPGMGHDIAVGGGRRRVTTTPPGLQATLETSQIKFVKQGAVRDPMHSSASCLLEPTAAAAAAANFTIGAQRGASQGHLRFSEGRSGDVDDPDEFEVESGQRRFRGQFGTCGNFGRAGEEACGDFSRAVELASFGRQAVGSTYGQLVEIQQQQQPQLFHSKPSSQVKSYSCRGSPELLSSQVGCRTSTLPSKRSIRDVILEKSGSRNDEVQQRSDAVDNLGRLRTAPRESVGCIWSSSIAGSPVSMSDRKASMSLPFPSGSVQSVAAKTLIEDADDELLESIRRSSVAVAERRECASESDRHSVTSSDVSVQHLFSHVPVRHQSTMPVQSLEHRLRVMTEQTRDEQRSSVMSPAQRSATVAEQRARQLQATSYAPARGEFETVQSVRNNVPTIASNLFSLAGTQSQ